MKIYTAPTLKLSFFADDESIVASKPVSPEVDTPEDTFPKDPATTLPNDPFSKK